MAELIEISDTPGQPELKGPNAARMLEIAKNMLAKGQKGLALAWAVRAEKRAIQEGNTPLAEEAAQIAKALRAEIQAKIGYYAMSGQPGFGDESQIHAGLAKVDNLLSQAVNALKDEDQGAAYDLVDEAWDEMRVVLRRLLAYRVVEKKDYPEAATEIKKRLNRFVGLFLVVK